MLDIKWIRENEEEFNAQMQKRGIKFDTATLLELEEDKRQIVSLIQKFQQAKNIKTERLAHTRGTKEFDELKNDVVHINEKLSELYNKLREDSRLEDLINNIPNILAQDVPYGTDETMNKLVRKYKEVTKIEGAKEHFTLGVNLGMMDFEQTAKICGSRFVTLKKDLARMARALISFMIDCHIEEHDFEEVAMPVLVKPDAMYHVGQLPKFADESYSVSNDKYRLIPTGEVSMTNLVADSILKKEELPLRYVGYSECFRAEAGSAGRDTRGMIRNHQFGKVELVTITTSEDAEEEHQKMLTASENILKKLDLPYRVMLLCTGDIGFASKKTYDIEVWLPGQELYREIASISNCGDFQSRRMKARYKNEEGDNIFLHTLNGSGLPIGRTLVAILENYQNSDGSINVPEVLQKYMNGKKVIGHH
ncbi:MAG: serine--tRNA ligase [Rickettsiaceae bacterium]|nr:serine--tRNA ligase [Rickettsiaceae bacterium]